MQSELALYRASLVSDQTSYAFKVQPMDYSWCTSLHVFGDTLVGSFSSSRVSDAKIFMNKNDGTVKQILHTNS